MECRTISAIVVDTRRQFRRLARLSGMEERDLAEMLRLQRSQFRAYLEGDERASRPPTIGRIERFRERLRERGIVPKGLPEPGAEIWIVNDDLEVARGNVASAEWPRIEVTLRDGTQKHYFIEDWRFEVFPSKSDASTVVKRRIREELSEAMLRAQEQTATLVRNLARAGR